MLSLSATFWFANAVRLHSLDTALLVFERETGVIEQNIRERLKSYEDLLYGARALFIATGGVMTRDQWRGYVQGLQLEKRFPAIPHIGFAKRTPSSELAAHVAAMRQQGVPTFKVHPEGARPEYFSVTYLEPFTPQNAGVLGFDMWSETARRKAMMRARDSGQAAASGQITLVQETDSRPAPGFAMFLPLYRSAATPVALGERRSSLAGFIFGQFRWDKLMTGVLGSQASGVDFEIFDGDTMTSASRLYGTPTELDLRHNDTRSSLNLTSKILFAGQNWSVSFTALEGFDGATAIDQPVIAAAAGLVISFLLFGMLMQLQIAARQDRDFRQMVETIKDYAIYLLDRDGRVATWNKGAQLIEGYEEEEIVGVHFSIFYPPEQRADGVPSRVLESAARDGRHEIEGWRVRKDGTRFWANVVITALRHQDGSLRGYMKVSRDITGRKKNELTIAARNRDLETLLHVTSHDLREPLRAIESFSRLTYDRYAKVLDENGQDFLRRVVRAAKRMDQLLVDVLTVSRAQRAEAVPEDVSGEVMVRDALNRWGRKIRDSGAKIRLYDGLPRLQVDKTWVTSALSNLIGNALKFTRPGEVPDVEIGPYHAPSDDRDTVGIEVRDRGPGVPPEQSERVFQLFHRAVGRDVEGTGAGLAIVRQIAQRHGGNAWVEPRPGGGSVFIITFAKGEKEAFQDGG